MLPPIPMKILRSRADVKACVSTDMYQKPVYEYYTVTRVHLQPSDRIVKTASNTDQQLSGILFVDAKRSAPALDWRALLQRAHDRGGDLRVTVRGVEYTVMTAEGLRDDSDRLHHWEIGVM